MPDGEASTPRTYVPRPANGTPLQCLVGATLLSFAREAERALPNGVPRFVAKSLTPEARPPCSASGQA